MSGMLASIGGGDGGHLLVLLHGLGANNGVWRPMLCLVEQEWEGTWIAPDFAGHGRSPWRDTYSYQDHASSILELTRDADCVSILGHSMGAAVALEMSSLAPSRVVSIAALSMKLSFSAEEMRFFSSRATSEITYYRTADEARQRYLKVAGLTGKFAVDSQEADRGIFRDERGFRLAMDPRAFGIASDPLPSASQAACNLTLATGSNDPIAPPGDMRLLFPESVVFENVAHNAHVEAPHEVWCSLSSVLRRA